MWKFIFIHKVASVSSTQKITLLYQILFMWHKGSLLYYDNNNNNIHNFLPAPRKRSHVKSDNAHIVIHPLAHILDTCALIFSSCALFCSLSQPHHVTSSLPSLCDNHQSTGGRSERTQCQAKMAAWNSFSYICTRTLNSFRSLRIGEQPPPSFLCCLRPLQTIHPA